MLLYINGAWGQIGTVTANATTIHIWDLTETQRNGISGDVYIAFFSIKPSVMVFRVMFTLRSFPLRQARILELTMRPPHHIC